MGEKSQSIGSTCQSEQVQPIAHPAHAPHQLTQRHFVCQDDRPPHLGDVELTEMDPSLRVLLFTDGTVTRTLEAQGLARVTVGVAGQASSTASGQVANHLEVPSGMESVRRRVVISTGATPIIWAESHIVPCRLPAGFLSVLHDTPDGIGESLQQVKLESWRDMLWFGLDSPPEWSYGDPQVTAPVISRLYRVITGGRPALLISESFAVKRRGDVYQLAWPS